MLVHQRVKSSLLTKLLLQKHCKTSPHSQETTSREEWVEHLVWSNSRLWTKWRPWTFGQTIGITYPTFIGWYWMFIPHLSLTIFGIQCGINILPIPAGQSLSCFTCFMPCPIMSHRNLATDLWGKTCKVRVQKHLSNSKIMEDIRRSQCSVASRRRIAPTAKVCAGKRAEGPTSGISRVADGRWWPTAGDGWCLSRCFRRSRPRLLTAVQGHWSCLPLSAESVIVWKHHDL